MNQTNKITAAIACFYLIYIFLFLAKFNFNPSATIELTTTHAQEYGRPLPTNLIVQQEGHGHDGQYYYMIATDLSHEHITVKTFRHQRILYPLLANSLAFGQIALIPWTLLIINYVATLLGTYILLLILQKHGANLNLAFVWALNVGFLNSILRDLTGPLMFLFILLFIYFHEKQKLKLSSFYLSCALLTNELTLSIIFPLLLSLSIQKDYKKIKIYSWPLIVLFIWQSILFLRFGHFPLVTSAGMLWHFTSMDFLGVISKIDIMQGLRSLYHQIPGLPVFIFCIIQCWLLVQPNNKKEGIYFWILVGQLIYIFMVKVWVGDLDRYAVGLFLFSLLYSTQKKEAYNLFLIILMFVMSALYFIERIIFFKINYLIS